jgi:hypothetical protein
VKDRDIVDIKLHRAAVDSNGPVVALLGSERKGSVTIGNPVRDELLRSNLYMVVYTGDEPRGAVRGKIRKRDD